MESVFGRKRLIMVLEKDFYAPFLVPLRSSVDASNETWEPETELLRSKLSGKMRLFSNFDIPSFSAKSLLSLFMLS